MSVVVVDDDAKCNLLLERAPKCLRKVIVVKEVRAATKQRAKNRGVEILRFADVETLGTKHNHPELPPKPSDLCTICYTSGTTGNPKGVMLTHENVVASIAGVLLQMGDHRLRTDDVLISFLPLAHMLERCCEVSGTRPRCATPQMCCSSVVTVTNARLFLELLLHGRRCSRLLLGRHTPPVR